MLTTRVGILYPLPPWKNPWYGTGTDRTRREADPVLTDKQLEKSVEGFRRPVLFLNLKIAKQRVVIIGW
jgi:hypothetical protein